MNENNAMNNGVCENNVVEAAEPQVQVVEVERKLTTGEKVAGIGLLGGAIYAACDLGYKGFKFVKKKIAKRKEAKEQPADKPVEQPKPEEAPATEE